MYNTLQYIAIKFLLFISYYLFLLFISYYLFVAVIQECAGYIDAEIQWQCIRAIQNPTTIVLKIHK